MGKLVSTTLTVVVIIAGISLKLMRLHRATKGEAVSAFQMGQEAGEAAAQRAAVNSDHVTNNNNVQSNPFVD